MPAGALGILALQNEVALLRAANAELAESNAAHISENGTLKTRLSELEALVAGGKDVRCANCGHAPTALSLTAADEPTLPNEIFLMIAVCLGPGSRSLSNLARTCRSLYQLLVPKLYEHFEVAKLDLKLRNLSRRSLEQCSTLPNGLTSVKFLDVHVQKWDSHGILYLISACRNVERLKCAWFDFLNIISNRWIRPQLHTLELDLNGDLDTVLRPYHGMPNLRHLFIAGRPYTPALQFFLTNFHSLTSIDVEFYEGLQEWDVSEMPEDFVSKIRRWMLCNLRTLRETIETFPMFAPEAIIRPEDYELYEPSPHLWQLICNLTSVKSINLDVMYSSMFLLGLPPNLEDFYIRDLRFVGIDDLGRLDALLTSTMPRIRFQIFHSVLSTSRDDHMDDAKFRRYVDELRIWLKVPGFELERDERWEEFEDRRKRLGLPEL